MCIKCNASITNYHSYMLHSINHTHTHTLRLGIFEGGFVFLQKSILHTLQFPSGRVCVTADFLLISLP